LIVLACTCGVYRVCDGHFDIPGDQILHTGGSPEIPELYRAYVQRPTVAKSARNASAQKRKSK
jgi:hypothetical protein